MAGNGANSGSLIGTFAEMYGNQLEFDANNKAMGWNKYTAKENAKEALRVGQEMERRQRIIGNQAIGDIKSGYAASGVTLEGSALDVLEYSTANAERDALNIRYESKLKSAQYTREAQMIGEQQKSGRKAHGWNQVASFFGGGGKLFG